MRKLVIVVVAHALNSLLVNYNTIHYYHMFFHRLAQVPEKIDQVGTSRPKLVRGLKFEMVASIRSLSASIGSPVRLARFSE